MLRLLLLSSSRDPTGSYLEYAAAHIRDFLGPPARPLAFVPFAAVTVSYDDYARRVAAAFAPMGYSVASVHDAPDAAAALRAASAIVVGGGNTFRLLERLHATGLLSLVGETVRGGVPYLGWSAGSNLACPTIRTTNDMPVVEPPALAALGLVPFQINPHYTDFHPPGHRGETRAERLAEFVELNARVHVVGLREGSMLRVEGDEMTLLGPERAPCFRRGEPVRELDPGTSLAFLLRDA